MLQPSGVPHATMHGFVSTHPSNTHQPPGETPFLDLSVNIVSIEFAFRFHLTPSLLLLYLIFCSLCNTSKHSIVNQSLKN